MNDFERENQLIRKRQARLKAARMEIRLSQADIEEYLNPLTSPKRKEELLAELLADLCDPFEELGYSSGWEGDSIAVNVLSDILLGNVEYSPSKGKFLPFVERLIRNKGVDDHRKRSTQRRKAEDSFEYKLADITHANSLVEFTDSFPLVETIEEEISNLRLKADREIVTALLDHLKQHGEIPSNLHISKVTGYGPAHVATRLKESRKHLRSAILAKAERMEGVDIDTLHLSF